ncbi:MAG TPA: AAA family ATPase [Dissulfurispiraceae bacterium]|nr:AAA family ATPase [Dissulfurispiraceae bacterium]
MNAYAEKHDRAAIVAELEQMGTTFKGNACRCPFHDDNNPSAGIFEREGLWFFKCHTCDWHGDVFDIRAHRTKQPLAEILRAADGRGAQTRTQTNGGGHAAKSAAQMAEATDNEPANGFVPAAIQSAPDNKRHEVAAYDYTDETGTLLYQTVRYEPKDFRQRRPDGNGGWIYSLGNARRVLYHLPQLLQADPDAVVFVVEGEKDVHTLESIGLVATTNPMGAGKWPNLCKDPSFQEPLRGRRVCVMGDNNETGQRHVRQVADSLATITREARIVKVPDGCVDISAYIESRDSVDGSELRGLLLSWHNAAAVYGAKPRNALTGIQLTADMEEPIEWLWHNKFPANMFSMIAGLQGAGKSFFVTYIISVVTTGRWWIDCVSTAPASKVLLFNGEESIKHAIVPRLKRNGADLSKIRVINGVERGEDGKKMPFNLREFLDALETELRQDPEIKLVILDPITSYLGGVDENSNADVRELLEPLAKLAEEIRVTIIGISHLNKKNDLRAVQRTIGSTAFSAVPRAVWLVDTEPTEKDIDGNMIKGPRWRRALPAKTSLSEDPTGLRYKIVKGEVIFDDQPCLQDVDEAINPESRRESHALDVAKHFLEGQLANGEKLANEIFDAADAENISKGTLRRARERLNVKMRMSKMEGGSMWRLP